MKKMLFTLLLLASIIGCNTTNQSVTVDENTTPENSETTTMTLTEKQWNLTEVNGTAIVLDSGTMKVPHFILKDDKKITGYSGCNIFNGSYELVENTTLKVSPLMSTMMACEGVTYEQDYMKVFGDSVTISFDDDKLVLTNSALIVTAKFTAQALVEVK